MTDLRRLWAPEAGDVVAWKPAGQGVITGRPYTVIAVDGGRLLLRDQLFRRSDGAGCEAWWETETDRGCHVVVETAEERVAREMMA